ncbi:hypothetical protein [Actinomyces slackii]|nr:hypothetical protein [Actinomyces slackii]
MTSDEVEFEVPRLGGSTKDKFAWLLREADSDVYDIVFVHHDADRAGIQARISEIKDGSEDWREEQEKEQKGEHGQVVPVVPVVATEAWALAGLLDDPEQRGRLARQGLKQSSLEGVADPKDRLRQALCDPGGSIPKKDFERERRRLLRDLNISGTVSQLAAWKRLEADMREAVLAVRPWYKDRIRADERG